MAFKPDRFNGTRFLGTEDVDEYTRLLHSKFPFGSAVFPAGIWLLLTNGNQKNITEDDDRLQWYLTRKWFQNIGQADVVYVPILYSAHWILATINYQTHVISMYNSLAAYAYDKERIHDNLQRLAGFLRPTTKGATYTFIVDTEGCKQKDSYNCGVHVLQRIRSNVLGDILPTMPIDQLRLHFKNELMVQDVILFRNIIIIDDEDEQKTEPVSILDGLQIYYMNGFKTVKQLAYPSRRHPGILRVNQPIDNTPTFIIKFVTDGQKDRIEAVFRDSVAAGITIHGLMLNPPTLDQNFIGLLLADKE